MLHTENRMNVRLGSPTQTRTRDLRINNPLAAVGSGLVLKAQVRVHNRKGEPMMSSAN